MDVQNIKDEIISVLKDILDSVELHENQLAIKYKMLTSYVNSDTIAALLSEFQVYTDNLEQENRSQEIIHLLLNEISEQENKIHMLLLRCKVLEYPEWADTLEILKEENCIVNYIRESIYCFNEGTERDDFIKSLSGKSLKKELISYVNKETQSEYLKFYENFSENDYENAIEFVKIDINNDKISELDYDINELKRFSSLFNLFNYKNIRNVYASSLIDIISAISEPIHKIIRIKYPNAIIQSNKITNNLVALHKEYPECFFIDSCDKYVDIMEPIERRNMYIHNQGVANEKYIGFRYVIKDNNWNGQGIKDGDFLQIDGYYYQDVYDLITSFVNNL